MAIETVNVELAPGRTVTIETGKLAMQAGGAVTVRQGDTIVLVAACSADPRPGLDFFPLQVDYREKFSAAGRFPGGYFKREGRPSEKEILTARMTDRPLRPLFPKGFINDVQIMAGLLSADGDNEADVISMVGASAALMLSDIPFAGPVGALRVGRVDGSFIANPTHTELQRSDLDLVYAGVEGKVIMIEGSAQEIGEDVLRDALAFADEAARKLISAQRDLAARAGKPKQEATLHLVDDGLLRAAHEFCAEGGRLEKACCIPDKTERRQATAAIFNEMVDALTPQLDTGQNDSQPPKFKAAFDEVTETVVRRLVLEQDKRMDGRALDQLRPINCEVGILPRTHGSALFDRGETQALVTTTLGGEREAQECDALTGGDNKKSFLLHYNFPHFSVGETGRIMGPGRREVGHGALAERCVAPMIDEDCEYTVRCVSDILSSNGSSSMASVCGASLALMDAGVPMAKPVAGISVGLVSGEAGEKKYLVDILGAEDHYGDMDFKVAGTKDGITGFQLDLKIGGLDLDSINEAMRINREARLQILEIMGRCLPASRPDVSEFAPKIFTIKINPERIGALIGPGGKVIREITDTSGAQIDVHDDGTVNIFAVDSKSLESARKQVEAVAAEAEIGKIYHGVVKTVKDFGAFVEIVGSQDGLLHISEMANYRVKDVEDICKVGDIVPVKVIDIDDRGRVRLSRRAALAELEQAETTQEQE